MSHSRVVNVRDPKVLTYDWYVGRGKDPRTGRGGMWGNPFDVRTHGKEAMRLYLERIRADMLRAVGLPLFPEARS